MGEPASLSADDRARLVALARAIVDSVRCDVEMPEPLLAIIVALSRHDDRRALELLALQLAQLIVEQHERLVEVAVLFGEASGERGT